jgi:hypothetical protein
MDRARHHRRSSPGARGERDQLVDRWEMCSDICLISERNRHSYRPESEDDFSLACRIGNMPSEEPFLSVRQIDRKKKMSKSVVYGHLTQIMRWKFRYLQGIAPSPTESEK